MMVDFLDRESQRYSKSNYPSHIYVHKIEFRSVAALTAIF